MKSAEIAKPPNNDDHATVMKSAVLRMPDCGQPSLNQPCLRACVREPSRSRLRFQHSRCTFTTKKAHPEAAASDRPLTGT